MENPAPPAITSDDRLWGSIAHFSACAGYATGIGFLAGPLIVWLWKRDTSPFVGEQGKEALNFNLSILIYFVACILLCFTFIFLFFVHIALGLLGAFHLICIVIAGLKAYEGESFRYPLNLRLIK